MKMPDLLDILLDRLSKPYWFVIFLTSIFLFVYLLAPILNIPIESSKDIVLVVGEKKCGSDSVAIPGRFKSSPLPANFSGAVVKEKPLFLELAIKNVHIERSENVLAALNKIVYDYCIQSDPTSSVPGIYIFNVLFKFDREYVRKFKVVVRR